VVIPDLDRTRRVSFVAGLKAQREPKADLVVQCSRRRVGDGHDEKEGTDKDEVSY
jgi:hypothetical protein